MFSLYIVFLFIYFNSEQLTESFNKVQTAVIIDSYFSLKSSTKLKNEI